jgi:hypothetical protein
MNLQIDRFSYAKKYNKVGIETKNEVNDNFAG